MRPPSSPDLPRVCKHESWRLKKKTNAFTPAVIPLRASGGNNPLLSCTAAFALYFLVSGCDLAVWNLTGWKCGAAPELLVLPPESS